MRKKSSLCRASFTLFGIVALLVCGLCWDLLVLSGAAAKPDHNRPESWSNTKGSLIDFEGLSDSTPVTDQYPNVTFSRATAIKAGISLNEFEARPHSGAGVIFDDGGPMELSFAIPITSLAGYFSYSSKITLIGFDEKNVQVATAASSFNRNFAVSGDTGSQVNELLSINYQAGISRVVINGATEGGSFALDDLTMGVAVKILFHDHGRSNALKRTSPNFEAIHLAAEEVLGSCEPGGQLQLIVKPEDIDEIKKNDTSIELIYGNPRDFGIGASGDHAKTIRLDRFLIPLSGKHVKPQFTTIFHGLGGYGAGPYTSSGPALSAMLTKLRSGGLLN